MGWGEGTGEEGGERGRKEEKGGLEILKSKQHARRFFVEGGRVGVLEGL